MSLVALEAIYVRHVQEETRFKGKKWSYMQPTQTYKHK